jgi:acetoin:2,6-dichlorophenolindophenol oxidoreductase subunit alpha
VTAGLIPDRARTLQVPTTSVDGNDFLATHAAAAAAVGRARAGEGPQFIESLTYRYVGHSRSDPGRYRKPGELDAWRDRDPLKLGRISLIERLGARAAQVDEVEADVERQMAAVQEASVAAPYPTPGSAREFKVSTGSEG